MGGLSSEEVEQLLDRRAALVAARPADDGGSTELEELTALLRTELWGRPPVVRRVRAGDALVDDLGRREPVNPPAGPDDLARRVAEDRRLMVLERAESPGRPVNVVWVALTRGVPRRLADVLEPDLEVIDPTVADTAVFHSIWNADPRLDGLGRGTTLLEETVAGLRSELPGLTTFVTLSPVPGLRSWAEREGIDPPTADGEATRLAARYLTRLRDDGRPLDPVARFHLGNGARLWRVLPGADPSARGTERSFGVMANYRYEPEDRAANRARLTDGAVVVGDEVAALLDDA